MNSLYVITTFFLRAAVESVKETVIEWTRVAATTEFQIVDVCIVFNLLVASGF